MTDISTSLPDLDLAPAATMTVDAGAAGAVIMKLVLHGTYFPPGSTTGQDAAFTVSDIEWLNLPSEQGAVV